MRWQGLKSEAWESVRRYVKKKEGDKCYTCPKSGARYLYDTGHYLPVALVGSNNTLSWDERQLHRQCKSCNGAGEGMHDAYRMHLVRDYGEPVVLEFEKRRWRVDKVTDWQAVIDHYNNLYNAL